LHPRRLGHNQASWLLEDGHSPPSWNRTSISRSSGGYTAIVRSVGTGFRPRRSRRLESNQPEVLYPKQAAHLAPPPREYPGVELNHASDVRSVGSDPSTGACRLPWYRVRESNPRFRSENPVSLPAGRTRRCDARGRAPGGRRTRCTVQVRGLEPRWLVSKTRVLPLDDTRARRRAVTRGRTEPSRIPGERAAPRSP
jgi:hypothetical protein